MKMLFNLKKVAQQLLPKLFFLVKNNTQCDTFEMAIAIFHKF